MHVFLTVVKTLKLCFILVLVSVFVRVSAGAIDAAPPSYNPTASLTNKAYLPLVTKYSPTEGYAVVFVSRRIPARGSDYYPPANDLPGVGSYSRFRVASPGRLMVRDGDGNVSVLIDGARPSAATFNLIDVSAPDVSYDGTTIVFAGLPAGNYNQDPVNTPGAWRIYAIRTDGTGLRQITFSDMNLDLSQFGPGISGLRGYDDTDPAWLPDGRIVFSSTRWPAYAQYSGARTTNLFVVNADGGAMHRITSERNGADRPLVDPLTGKIVFSRWWRNYRFAVNSMATIPMGNGEYMQKDGLTIDRDGQLGGTDFLDRNAWHLASINPDGTDLVMWTGISRDDGSRNDMDNHAYGGSFTPSGDLLTTFFPMFNLSEAAGFGGIRRYSRGPGFYTGIIGITYSSIDYVSKSDPVSYGILRGNYAADPESLPSGRMIISWAPNHYQDYDLYTVSATGKDLIKLYGNPGTTELHARLIRQRPLPPIIPNRVSRTASPLPPPVGATRLDQDGTFTFLDLNVYANAPVDTPIVSAMPVGSAAKIRFFADHQRQSVGSFAGQDWPILLGEVPVNPDGSLINANVPANLPLFEQIRSADGRVPFTGGTQPNGAAHVAGLNYSAPGVVSRCVGCHAGHSMIAVPANDADARFSNLAPGATIYVSSTRDEAQNIGLIDRKVLTGEIWRYWTSAQGQPANGQWVQLTFPVPITVRAVKVYNPRFGDEAKSSLQVQSATVVLYGGANGITEVARQNVGPLSVSGTNVSFPDVRARHLRVYINTTTGTFYGMQVAGLAEVEVIARGEAGP